MAVRSSFEVNYATPTNMLGSHLEVGKQPERCSALKDTVDHLTVIEVKGSVFDAYKEGKL